MPSGGAGRPGDATRLYPPAHGPAGEDLLAGDSLAMGYSSRPSSRPSSRVIRATARLQRILRASGAAHLRGDLGPFQTLLAPRQYRALSASSAFALLDDLAFGHLMAGAAPGGETLLDRRARIDSPLVSAAGMLPVRLPG